jgi:hypothetical protein
MLNENVGTGDFFPVLASRPPTSCGGTDIAHEVGGILGEQWESL